MVSQLESGSAVTLRDLIHAVMNTGSWNKTTSIIYDTYYTENDSREDVNHAYMNVFSELIELPHKQTDDRIIIEQHTSLIPGVDDQSTIEKYVDVHLQDADDETYSMCYVDWQDLIDRHVVDRLDCNMNEQLAHVLWEITFHGFSNESVKQSRQDLEQQVNNIESGDDNLIEFDPDLWNEQT